MSSKTYLKANVAFLDLPLKGAALAEIARSYRPLMDLYDDQLTSCFFHRIGDGTGTMKVGASYEVLISLHMRASIEAHYGKSIREFFPPGRPLTLVAIPDRTVAKGTVDEILEVDDVDNEPGEG